MNEIVRNYKIADHQRGSSPISIQPLGPYVGAEIKGIDLAKSLAAYEKDAIDRALGDHGSCSSAIRS